MAYEAPDYYAIEELLTEEERLVRDTARRFVEEEFQPHIIDAYRNGTFPMQLVPRLAELGFFGSTLPEEYGCAGASSVAYGLISQELERGDSGLRSFASVQSSLVMYPIFTFGSESQKSNWLPRMARGQAIGCFGLTEPDFGSNPAGMRTSAKRAKGGFVLERREALDHQRQHRRRRGRLGATRRQGARLPRRERSPGFQGRADARQAEPARVGHLGAVFRQVLDPRGEPPAGHRLDEGAARRASRRRATGSPGARSARPSRATTARCATRRVA